MGHNALQCRVKRSEKVWVPKQFVQVVKDAVVAQEAQEARVEKSKEVQQVIAMIKGVQHHTITPAVDQEGVQKALRQSGYRKLHQTNTQNLLQVLHEEGSHVNEMLSRRVELAGCNEERGRDPPIQHG